MLGRLIDSLDDPEVASRLIAALNQPDLAQRLAAAAQAEDRPVAMTLAIILRQFADRAGDDQWTQLIGVMNRAEDPGLAAVRAILLMALPEAAPAGAAL